MRFNLNEATWIPEYARKKLEYQVSFDFNKLESIFFNDELNI